MFTRKVLNEKIQQVISKLREHQLSPTKIILFGSYNNGGVHPYSDIDLAVWSPHFTGDFTNDLELLRPVLRACRGIDFKLYPEQATGDNYDPFIHVIEKTGKVIYEAAKKSNALKNH